MTTIFKCECGAEVEQKRKGRRRTKCPECHRKAKRAYLKAYYQAHKVKPLGVSLE